MRYKILLLIFMIACCAGKPCCAQLKNGETQKTDTLGTLIINIAFEVKGQDKEDFEDGIQPWININNPNKDLKQLVEKDAVVIPDHQITIIIDYPLTNQYRFEMQSPTGFTRVQLIKEISKRYHLIYKEEKHSSVEPVVPAKKRSTTINRNKTDGKYGVWGHDITDLDLSSIEVYKSADGKIYLSLGIES